MAKGVFVSFRVDGEKTLIDIVASEIHVVADADFFEGEGLADFGRNLCSHSVR